MTQFILAPEAIKDLEKILDYLAAGSLDSGENFLDAFQKKCRFLTQFPKMGRSYERIRDDLRGLPLKGYVIFYRVSESQVEILRVIQGNRDFEALFDVDEM